VILDRFDQNHHAIDFQLWSGTPGKAGSRFSSSGFRVGLAMFLRTAGTILERNGNYGRALMIYKYVYYFAVFVGLVGAAHATAPGSLDAKCKDHWGANATVPKHVSECVKGNVACNDEDFAWGEQDASCGAILRHRRSDK
jgi:hypothetical protein